MDPIKELNIKLVDIIKELNELLIKNPREKLFYKKYNLRILNEIDPNGLISKSLRLIYKAFIYREDNDIGGYLFDTDIMKHLQRDFNGFGKDITRGTQLKFFPESLGYYSFLYYLYRYTIIYSGRILKYTYGMRSKTYKFVQDILEKPYGTPEDVLKLLQFFYIVGMELDGSNNSPLILVSNKPLHDELKLVSLDLECFNYLKEHTFIDKALITGNFKIHRHYVDNYMPMTTTNAGQIALKAKDFIKPQTLKLNTFLSRRTIKQRKNNNNNSTITKKFRTKLSGKKNKSKNRQKSFKKRKQPVH